MSKYRVWWDNPLYCCELIEAKTAQDALTIATLNFSSNNLKPIRMEYEEAKEAK